MAPLTTATKLVQAIPTPLYIVSALACSAYILKKWDPDSSIYEYKREITEDGRTKTTLGVGPFDMLHFTIFSNNKFSASAEIIKED